MLIAGSRAWRHNIYRSKETETDIFALVPPHHSPYLLLVLIQPVHGSSEMVRCHELHCALYHVHLLCIQSVKVHNCNRGICMEYHRVVICHLGIWICLPTVINFYLWKVQKLSSIKILIKKLETIYILKVMNPFFSFHIIKVNFYWKLFSHQILMLKYLKCC